MVFVGDVGGRREEGGSSGFKQKVEGNGKKILDMLRS